MLECICTGASSWVELGQDAVNSVRFSEIAVTFVFIKIKGGGMHFD